MIYSLSTTTVLALSALSGLGISVNAFSPEELKIAVKAHSQRTPLKDFASYTSLQSKSVKNLRTSEESLSDYLPFLKPKPKQNKSKFMTFSAYEDEGCTQRVYQYGILLDNCVSEVHTSGEHRSWRVYLVKNRRARDSYFIDGFSGDDCVGSPSVTISYLEVAYDNYDESIDYYKCRWDPSDSVYVKFEEDPLKKVPDYRDGYMSIVADTDRCSTDLKRPNLYEFSWQKQLEDFPIPGCLNYDSGASIYFRACDKGTIYYDIYYRHDCVGSIDVPNNVLGNGFCYAPGADDEGWTDVGAAESLYCLS